MLSEIGWLQRCNHCGEYWPADGEFFPRDAPRPRHRADLQGLPQGTPARAGHTDEEAAEARAA